MLESMWRKGNSPTLWWECKLVRPLWETVWRFLREQKTELPYDPAISLLGIYLDKYIIQKDIHTLMFITALFTTAKIWMAINRWMDKEDVVYINICVYIHLYIYTHIYNGIPLSHKKNEIICSNMDATKDYHTKWS